MLLWSTDFCSSLPTRFGFGSDAQAQQDISAQIAALKGVDDPPRTPLNQKPTFSPSSAPSSSTRTLRSSCGSDEPLSEALVRDARAHAMSTCVLQAAKDQRLRRICEVKPSGRCQVPPEVHEAWRRGGLSKDKLMKTLEECGMDKACKSYVAHLQ